MTYAPIAVFAYNRPQHLQRLLQTLQACPECAQSPVTIYCDGARKPEDQSQIDATRVVAHQYAPKHATIIERPANIGLAKSIITGVTENCDKYGRVIVLEDDLELSPQTLAYFNGALDHYKADERVVHISGYTSPIAKDGIPPLFFHQETTCSGWATWARAWQHFNHDAAELLSRVAVDKATIKRFNIGNGAGYVDMLRAQIRGRINSWAIRWYASMFLRGGLSLFARQPLIRNAGHDGTGIHSLASNNYEVALSDEPQIFDWPDAVVQDELAFTRSRRFWLRNNPPLTFWRRAKGKIRRTWNGFKADLQARRCA